MKDANCIFCKIASGQVPSARLLEDEVAFAFLDIGPLAEGHALLVPKDHYVTIDQMPPAAAADLLRHLPALAGAVKAAVGAEGVNILQNNGLVAHQVVQHVHFHIIPRRAGDEFHFNWPAGRYATGRTEELAEKIRQALRDRPV